MISLSQALVLGLKTSKALKYDKYVKFYSYYKSFNRTYIGSDCPIIT
jgi:hypothetical protein